MNPNEENTMLASMTDRIRAEIDRLAGDPAAGEGTGPWHHAGSPDGEAPALPRQALRARLRYLRQIESALAHAGAQPVWSDRAGLGSTVRLRDAGTGREITYTLMVGDVLDLDAGEISIASPVGQALLGCQAGEEVQATTPHGTRRLRVLALETLPSVLGFDRLREPSAV